MNYKLALELKKAGFPQGDELSCPCQDIPFDERRNLMSKLDCGAEGVYKPTLEELTDVLPSSIEHEILGTLFLYIYCDAAKKWHVLYGKWGEILNWQPIDKKYDSLAERIAVTWLALQKNK